MLGQPGIRGPAAALRSRDTEGGDALRRSACANEGTVPERQQSFAKRLGPQPVRAEPAGQGSPTPPCRSPGPPSGCSGCAPVSEPQFPHPKSREGRSWTIPGCFGSVRPSKWGCAGVGGALISDRGPRSPPPSPRG